MVDVYENCPTYANSAYTLRFVSFDDCKDLLKVYSDTKAVPLFNSDNCYGDKFYYTNEEEISKAVQFWIDKYNHRDFVRWSVVENVGNEVIGTIELFHRDAKDAYTNCGLLRLDLRHDYENSTEIVKILSLIIKPTFDLFDCDKIATKAIPEADERICALQSLGFEASDERLIGHDGTEYDNYFVLKQN